jgi:RimJ/RimL family protein N-acetyltransferase
MIRVETHSSLDLVRDPLYAHLLQREVEHNMLLSLIDRSGTAPLGPDRALAVAYDGAQVVGVAFSHFPPGRALVLSEMPAEAAVAIAAALAKEGRAVPRIVGPPAAADAFAREWVEHTGVRCVRDLEMRLLALDALVPCALPAGSSVVASSEHWELIRRWENSFVAEIGESPAPDERLLGLLEQTAFQIWFDEAGMPVSMAAIVRETPGVVAISLVYTPEQQRRRGYATACVGALCERALARGKRCALYADVKNPASNRVYERLGFRQVATAWKYTFHGAIA